MMRMCLVLIAAAALAGCANTETLMRNASGDTRYCYLVHNSGFERITATDQYTRCLNEAGAAGFQRVDK